MNGQARASAFDQQIARSARSGRSALQICEELTSRDIRDAWDALLPVYRETGGLDGYGEPMIGAHTVNTVPAATATALPTRASRARTSPGPAR
jgi:hypothetical protein